MRGGDHPNAALEEKASGGVGIDWSTYDKAPKNEAETKRETNNNEPRLQKVGGEADPVSHNERVLRDALDDHLRKSGMEVIGTDEGQRVLDAANGEDVRKMSFGEPYDYEKYPLGRVEPGIADKDVNVVDADANHGFANYKEAKEWAKGNISKTYNNEETGGKGNVRISNAAIDKFMSQSAINKSDGKDVHMAVLKVLPEVLKESIDVETHPDFLKGENGKRSSENGINKDVLVHRLYGAVSIDGKPHRVKITLKEEARNKNLPHNTHSYEATKIELLEGTLVKPEGDNPNTNNSITAAKLLNGVEMSYNPGVKVLDESEKQVRFFRTKDGEAYGFTVGGRIYYDPKIATSETLVHEYAHLWASALRGGNAEEWKNVVGLMKGTSVWDEVKRLYPELKTDDEIADEVIAQYSGRRGAERLREEAEKIAEGDVYGKAEAISAMEKIRRALSKFWKGVCDMLHIHYTSAEEVADRVMKDLLDGVDPRKFGKTDGGARMHENTDKATNIDKKKALHLIEALQNHPETTIRSEELSSAAKVVENFEKPKGAAENVAAENVKFRLLEDDDPKAQELEALPDSELVPVYRNVQAFEDDALGSPMAFTDAETGERRELQGQKWNYSNPPEVKLTEEQQRQLDELNKNGYIMVDSKKTTELQINDGLKFVKPKTKEAQLQYFLKKNPEDKGLWAAYDPYDHAIETPLNTQFDEAYKRPNLVVVRSLIPKSEIDEPFKADYALLPTGAHQWNNGRTLYLSRWSKIDKVLTREEEAKLIDEYWKKNPGKREALKSHRDYNRFVPQVRRELEKMGYRFELDGKELTPEESLALDEQNWESRDVIPGREGNVPFVSNEDIKRINAKMSGKWVGEPKEAMENAMAERVNELAERLHTPVRIIRTDEEVASLPSARQRRMKGSFNPMTGEVTIVVPNNANLADVENTFVHEVVGHDGLRVLFPEEEKLAGALDELYRVSNEGIRQTIDRMAQKMYDAEVGRLREKKRREHEAKGEDANAHYYTDMAEAHAEASKKREQFKRDATEEYGADLAGRIGEKGFEKMSAEEQTFWGKLKAMLQKALAQLLEGLKIPGKRKWSDKDWAFVLHEAYKRKKNDGRPDMMDVADTYAMREKTGYGEVKFSDGRNNNEPQIATTMADMKQKVTELFEKANTGEFAGKPASIGRLSAEGKAFLEKLSGLNFKPFVDFVLNPSDLNHIRSDHYGENEKDKGNNVPLTDEDIQNMVDVLNQPDGILYGVDNKDGRKLFFFLKDAGNGLYNLTEVCSTKKGNLTAKSFFKPQKKGISQRVMEIKDSLLPTSVTYSGEFLSSDAKIPTLFEINEISSENVADEGMMFRDDDSPVEKHIAEVSKKGWREGEDGRLC